MDMSQQLGFIHASPIQVQGDVTQGDVTQGDVMASCISWSARVLGLLSTDTSCCLPLLPGQLYGYRRVFAHTADIFFERGIANPATVSPLHECGCFHRVQAVSQGSGHVWFKCRLHHFVIQLSQRAQYLTVAKQYSAAGQQFWVSLALEQVAGGLCVQSWLAHAL